MSAKKSKILGRGIYVLQSRDRYGDKQGRVFQFDPKTGGHRFIYRITKHQFMALQRHHGSTYVCRRDGNGRYNDWTLVGDLGAFYGEVEWMEPEEREERSTPLY